MDEAKVMMKMRKGNIPPLKRLINLLLRTETAHKWFQILVADTCASILTWTRMERGQLRPLTTCG